MYSTQTGSIAGTLIAVKTAHSRYTLIRAYILSKSTANCEPWNCVVMLFCSTVVTTVQLPAPSEHPGESSHLCSSQTSESSARTREDYQERGDPRYGAERAGARKAVVDDVYVRAVHQHHRLHMRTLSTSPSAAGLSIPLTFPCPQLSARTRSMSLLFG